MVVKPYKDIIGSMEYIASMYMYVMLYSNDQLHTYDSSNHQIFIIVYNFMIMYRGRQYAITQYLTHTVQSKYFYYTAHP